MMLRQLQVENLRNIRQATLEADEQLTVIAGPNGQGKTNLLECIWLLTGAKSFRGSRDADLVREEQPFGRTVGNVQVDDRALEIEVLVLAPQPDARSRAAARTAKINGVEYGRATAIAGQFTAVVFAPEHLHLIKGCPEGRRRFVDAALCQLYPNYIKILRRFARALAQKNALLKRYHETFEAAHLLDVFDAELTETGEEISRRRREYLEKAGREAERIYAELSKGAEPMQLAFCPLFSPGGLAQLLAETRQRDLRAGFCTTGPHREDFEVTINGRSGRAFGSQGQQRSAVLSLKLAEAAVAREVTGQHPVMLLDDVLSELDEDRQGFLLTRMKDRQCFVSTCDAAAFARTAGRVVMMKNGALEKK